MSNPSTSDSQMQSDGSNGIVADRDTPLTPVLIREMVADDLARILAIERDSFTSPWSPAMFAIETGRPSSISLVATEPGGRILGYIVVTRQDLAWHLMNVAVARSSRRMGLGSALVREAISRLPGRAQMTLEVRPSNLDAISLYKSLGFREWGVRPGYYPDDGEDALVMWLGDPVEAGVPREALGAT